MFGRKSKRIKELEFQLTCNANHIKRLEQDKMNAEKDAEKAKDYILYRPLKFIRMSDTELEAAGGELAMNIIEKDGQFGIPTQMCTYCGDYVYTWCNTYHDTLLIAAIIHQSGYHVYENFAAYHPECTHDMFETLPIIDVIDKEAITQYMDSVRQDLNNMKETEKCKDKFWYEGCLKSCQDLLDGKFNLPDSTHIDRKAIDNMRILANAMVVRDVPDDAIKNYKLGYVSPLKNIDTLLQN